MKPIRTEHAPSDVDLLVLTYDLTKAHREAEFLRTEEKLFSVGMEAIK
jgi:hypothetical protein